MAALGLHIGERDVVAAALHDGQVTHHAQTPWDGPCGDIEAFVNHVVGAVNDLNTSHLGPVWIVFPPGYIHLRRVPLEIAGARDRQKHIAWEAAQTLGYPTENILLRHWASGSSAIWEAVRADLVTLMTQRLEQNGLELGGVCAEPVALYHALHNESDTWRAGVALSADWISIAAGTERALVLAESFRIDPASKESLPDLADLVASRIRGRGERFASFSVAGQADDQLDEFAQHLSTAAGIEAPLLRVSSPVTTEESVPFTRIALAVGATRSSRTGIPS